MKVRSEETKRLKPLLIAVCAALALEFAGCKEGAGGSTAGPDAAAAGTETNSAATNASTSADTNAAASTSPSQ